MTNKKLEIINKIVWWIPIRSLRNTVRNKLRGYYSKLKLKIQISTKDKEKFLDIISILKENDALILSYPQHKLHSKTNKNTIIIKSYYDGRCILGQLWILWHRDDIDDIEIKADTKDFVHRSNLLDTYLDNKDLKGIEIGTVLYHSLGIKSIFIDHTDSLDMLYRKREIKTFGKALKIDVVAFGDDLPFEDNSLDYVLTSHVIEHFYDPIKTLKEWYRVIKQGGYIAMIVPDKLRNDNNPTSTSLQELIDRHSSPAPEWYDSHHAQYDLESMLELCKYMNFNVVETQDPDDRYGNGFTIIIQK